MLAQNSHEKPRFFPKGREEQKLVKKEAPRDKDIDQTYGPDSRNELQNGG
jgi:hypothetical protein